MDFQFWLYVILGAIYFLSRILKKQGQPQGESGKKDKTITSQQPYKEVQKQLSFEDLLREITEAKQSQKPVIETVTTKSPQYVDYDERLGDEIEDLEDVEYDYRKKDKMYETYENAKREAFLRPSLEETMSLSATDMKYGKFKVFETEERRDLLAEYTRNFKDPEGLRQAIVMSEILNRKF